MKKISNYLMIFSLFIGLGFVACSDKDDIVEPEVNEVEGILEKYSVVQLKTLVIEPTIKGFGGAIFNWEIIQDDDVIFSSKEKNLSYTPSEIQVGVFSLIFTVTKGSVVVERKSELTVIEKSKVEGILEEYNIKQLETLSIEPVIKGFDGGEFVWQVKQDENVVFSCKEKNLSYVPTEIGTYSLIFTATKDDDKVEQISKLAVTYKSQIEGVLENYTAERSKMIIIEPTVGIFEGGVFKWEVKNGDYKFTSTNKDFAFATLAEGTYQVTFTASKGELTETVTSEIMVEKEKKAYDAYITRVYDFLPAVGQFTNDLPKWVEGDTKESMIQKASKSIVGSQASMISLGGFGGYVEFGFDHTIVNVPGKRDFRVLGNAFWAAANPNKPGSRGGSCEPGIILVGYDKNNNGVPDEDEWYEIAGSEYYKKETIKNYQINFHKPEVEQPGAFDEYIKWDDNQKQSGYKPKNAFHKQPYYPSWFAGNTLSFKGTLLPNNAIDESGAGTYWVLYSFEYGYADNAPNDDPESAIDIDWAVDKDGKKVHLPGIDFVKVYTGVNQEAGWLGEVSTEVAGAYDLHIKGQDIPTRPETLTRR